MGTQSTWGEQSANMGCGASGEPVTEAKGPTPEEQAAALKVATDKQNKIMEEAVKAILKHSVVASCKTAGAVSARGSAGAYQVGGHFDKSLLPKLKAFAVTEFPPDAKLVETALRGVPFGVFTSECDEFIALLGEACESSALACEPIFLTAVSGLPVADAKAIFEGPPEAASAYLEDKCCTQICAECLPVVTKCLDGSKAAAARGGANEAFNKLPGVGSLAFTLEEWVMTQSVMGLFALIHQQEAAIRTNPTSTGDAICQDVFGNAALMKCKDAYTFVDEYEKGKKKKKKKYKGKKKKKKKKKKS